MEILRKIMWELRSLPKIVFLKIKFGKKISIDFIEDLFPRIRVVITSGKLVIGKGCHIKNDVDLDVRNGGKLILGRHVCINSNTHISAINKIEIGEYSELGPNIVIVDHDHDFRDEEGIRSQKYKSGSISIGKNVWIGANTVILRNSSIGDNCVVAAGCVIRGDFPENTVITQKRETIVKSYRRKEI